MDLLLNELLLSLIVILFTASSWIMLGRVGKLMMQEIEDQMGSQYTIDFNYLDDMPIDHTMGPVVILLCIVTYFIIRVNQIVKWSNNRFKPKEKLKKVNDQWDK